MCHFLRQCWGCKGEPLLKSGDSSITTVDLSIESIRNRLFRQRLLITLKGFAKALFKGSSAVDITTLNEPCFRVPIIV